jgi:hypothetical protein
VAVMPRQSGEPSEEDDMIIRRQMLEAAQCNRVSINMGEISIEVQSSGGGSPMITPRAVNTSSPSMHPTRKFENSSVGDRRSETGSVGTSGRRAVGGEIPSTPGSSPVKMKSETIGSQEGFQDLIVDEDVDLREPFNEEMDVDGDDNVPDDADERVENEDANREVLVEQNDEPMYDDDPAPEIPDFDDVAPDIPDNTNGPFGPNTQALFDTHEDYSVPELDLGTSSPEKPSPSHRRKSRKSFDDLELWIARKSYQYKVDEEFVWYALERTTGSKKTASHILKLWRARGGRPEKQGTSSPLSVGLAHL